MSKTSYNPRYEYPTYVPDPPEVSIGVVTYLPDREGYFEQRLEIIDQCLHSITYTMRDVDYELIIWCNASMSSFKRYLLDNWKEHRIVFCPYNAGMYRARTVIQLSARGKYLHLTDDDILFTDGWYPKMKAIIDACPIRPIHVGGMPATFNWPAPLSLVTLQKIRSGELKLLDQGSLISKERREEYFKETMTGKMEGEDTLIEVAPGINAWALGSHCSFLTERETFPIYPDPGTQVSFHWSKRMDNYLMEQGLIGLSTEEAVLHHMGNEIQEES